MEFNAESQKLNLSSAFNLESSIGDYGSIHSRNETSRSEDGFEPPDWKLENAFIHHATANLKSGSIDGAYSRITPGKKYNFIYFFLIPFNVDKFFLIFFKFFSWKK